MRTRSRPLRLVKPPGRRPHELQTTTSLPIQNRQLAANPTPVNRLIPSRQKLTRIKKRPALRQTFNCQANLRNCRNGAFEKNPLNQSGQSLLVSESPVGQAFPIRQDLTSLYEGIGSFKYNHRLVHRRGHLHIIQYHIRIQNASD